MQEPLEEDFEMVDGFDEFSNSGSEDAEEIYERARRLSTSSGTEEEYLTTSSSTYIKDGSCLLKNPAAV
jgi:hypothetical protein